MLNIWTGEGSNKVIHRLDWDDRGPIPEAVIAWADSGQACEGTKPMVTLPDGHIVSLKDILEWCVENNISLDGNNSARANPVQCYWIKHNGVHLKAVECRSTVEAYLVAWYSLVIKEESFQ